MRRNCTIALILVFAFMSLSAFAYTAPQNESELKARFSELWKTYFGEPEQDISGIKLSTGQPNEILFRELWLQCSPALSPEERSSAEAVFRFHILGDKRSFQSALKECLATKKFFPSKNGGILYYLFLEEEISDRSVIRLALPPGEGGENFLNSLSQLGESEAKIRTRFAVFIFKKLADEKLLRSVRSELPLMWFSMKGLAPSEALLGRVILSDENPFVKGEFKGDNSSLKLISVLTTLSGQITKIGVGNLGENQILIPTDGSVLYLLLINAGNEEQGQGLSATFWKDYGIPLSVEDVSLNDQFLKIEVLESGGILGYTISSLDENGRESETVDFPFTQSAGEGAHSYFYLIPKGRPLSSKLILKAHTFSGFTIPVPIQTEK
jgi:hypothetical protein